MLDLTETSAPRHPFVIAAVTAAVPEELCISDLVRLECSVRPLRLNDQQRLADLRRLFNSLVTLSIGSVVFDRAAHLRASHPKLKTADALHLATALHQGCAEFWTNDLELAKVPVPLAFRSF